MFNTSQCQRIALGSKSRDHAVGAQRYIGVVAEFFALVNVRNVHFDDRRFKGIQRVEDRNRRMGECGGIDHDAGCNSSRLVNPVDDLVFTIRLVKAKLKSELFGKLPAIGLDVGKGFVTVDVRLALAQQIQVRTVQHVDDSTHGWLQDQVCVSINSIRIFRSTRGSAAKVGNSDKPDETICDRMPAGTSGWREALSTTTSDTRSLCASAMADASCIPDAGTTRTA